METVLVAFPNLDYDRISIDVVRKWKIRESREIGDTVFFWVGDAYCQMPKADFDRAFADVNN
jgi:hypothetical protein